MDKTAKNILIGAGAIGLLYLLWRSAKGSPSQVVVPVVEPPISAAPAVILQPIVQPSVPSVQVVNPTIAPGVVVPSPVMPIISTPYSKLLSQATAVPTPLIQ